MTGTRWDLLPRIVGYYAPWVLLGAAVLAAWAYWATKDVR